MLGIKGMKSIIGGALTTMLCGGFSFAMSPPHSILPDISAAIAIITGVATTIHIITNTKKARLESRKISLETDLILNKCNQCQSPENCVFNPKHRPDTCKFKNDPCLKTP
jgi:hypothetical protein